MAKLRITYTKSTIGYSKDQKATILSLGLRKLNSSVIQDDTPSIRGMAFKVRHLVSVEEVADTAIATTPTVKLSARPTVVAEPAAPTSAKTVDLGQVTEPASSAKTVDLGDVTTSAADTTTTSRATDDLEG